MARRLAQAQTGPQRMAPEQAIELYRPPETCKEIIERHELEMFAGQP
jgi:hypothetical protein